MSQEMAVKDLHGMVWQFNHTFSLLWFGTYTMQFHRTFSLHLHCGIDCFVVPTLIDVDLSCSLEQILTPYDVFNVCSAVSHGLIM
jgi:hypothetical protein